MTASLVDCSDQVYHKSLTIAVSGHYFKVPLNQQLTVTQIQGDLFLLRDDVSERLGLACVLLKMWCTCAYACKSVVY